MQQRVQISDNSTEDLVGVGLFSIFTPALIILLIYPLSSAYVLPVCLTFWLAGIMIILVKRFNDQVEFDGQAFYVTSWQGRAKAKVSLADVTSMIRTRWGYRFYYETQEGVKKHFFLSPNEWFYHDKMVDELKQANPEFFTNRFYFRGLGIVVLRDEDWIR